MEWKLITVRISKPLHTALETKALQTNLTLGEYARHQLSETLSNQNQSASNNSVMEKKMDDLKRDIALNIDALTELVDKKFSATSEGMKNLNQNFIVLGKQVAGASAKAG
jgi:hypothetical protein